MSSESVMREEELNVGDITNDTEFDSLFNDLEDNAVPGSSSPRPSTTDDVSPPKGQVLVHFRKGGALFTEFTNLAFVKKARFLVQNAQSPPSKDENLSVWLDVRGPAENDIKEYHLGTSPFLRDKFNTEIKPLLGQTGYEFRVRLMSMRSYWPFDEHKSDSRSLKVSRKGVGYYYLADVKWSHSDRAIPNTKRFEDAVHFLFEDAGEEGPEKVTLDIPGHGSFIVNFLTDLVLSPDIQRILAKLTNDRSGKQATEVFIRKSNDAREENESIFSFSDVTPPSEKALNFCAKCEQDRTQYRKREGLPVQQECPFLGCEHIIETDKSSQNYEDTIRHLNTHCELYSRNEHEDMKATIARLEAQLAAKPSVQETAVPAPPSELTTSGMNAGHSTIQEENMHQDGMPSLTTRSNDSSKLMYCDTCLKSVNTLSDHVRAKHATTCHTTVAAFLHLTKEEAKARRAATSKAKISKQPATNKRKFRHNDEDSRKETQSVTEEQAITGRHEARSRDKASQQFGEPDSEAAPTMKKSSTMPAKTVFNAEEEPGEPDPPAKAGIKRRLERQDGEPDAEAGPPMKKTRTVPAKNVSNAEEDLGEPGPTVKTGNKRKLELSDEEDLTNTDDEHGLLKTKRRRGIPEEDVSSAEHSRAARSVKRPARKPRMKR